MALKPYVIDSERLEIKAPTPQEILQRKQGMLGRSIFSSSYSCLERIIISKDL